MTGKEIDEIFKEKLYSYQEKPSENLWDRIDMRLEKPSFWSTFKTKIIFTAVVVSSISLINYPLNENEEILKPKTEYLVSDSRENIDIKNNTVMEGSDNIQLQTVKTSSITVQNESDNQEFEEVENKNFKTNNFKKTKNNVLIESEIVPSKISLMQPVEITKESKKTKRFSISITINLKEGAFKNRQASPESDRTRVGHFLQQINNFRNGRKVDFKRVKK